jgi:DNA-binding XRE family transcriptional regulator
MSVQFVDIAGQKMAMLPAADYERLLAMAEDQLDVQAAEASERRRLAGEEYVPVELINRIIEGENPLRVWRQHRGLTLESLAQAVRTTSATLSRIETGQQQPKAQMWRALAEVLDVTVDDIMPDS